MASEREQPCEGDMIQAPISVNEYEDLKAELTILRELAEAADNIRPRDKSEEQFAYWMELKDKIDAWKELTGSDA